MITNTNTDFTHLVEKYLEKHLIDKLVSFWVIENNNHIHRFIKKRIIRKFWPELADVSDDICKYFSISMF